MWPHKSCFVAVVNHAIVPFFWGGNSIWKIPSGYDMTKSLPWKIHQFLRTVSGPCNPWRSVSHNQRVNTSNDSQFPLNMVMFPLKQGDFPMKNCDLCCRKFPMETGSSMTLPCDILRIPAATHDAHSTRPVTPAPYKLSPQNTMATCWANVLGFPQQAHGKQKMQDLTRPGKQSQKTMERKSHHANLMDVAWVNPLFLWPFSSSLFVCLPEGNPRICPKSTGPADPVGPAEAIRARIFLGDVVNLQCEAPVR